jgi:hypothetical protein
MRLQLHVLNGSGAHPASYPMGTRGSFPGGKAAGPEADHSLPSSAEVKEWVELYLHSPNTPSWCDAQLKHGDNFTFISSVRLAFILCELFQSFVPPIVCWWQIINLTCRIYTRLEHILPHEIICAKTDSCRDYYLCLYFDPTLWNLLE